MQRWNEYSPLEDFYEFLILPSYDIAVAWEIVVFLGLTRIYNEEREQELGLTVKKSRVC